MTIKAKITSLVLLSLDQQTQKNVNVALDSQIVVPTTQTPKQDVITSKSNDDWESF